MSRSGGHGNDNRQGIVAELTARIEKARSNGLFSTFGKPEGVGRPTPISSLAVGCASMQHACLSWLAGSAHTV
jgi:hypothetical protein